MALRTSFAPYRVPLGTLPEEAARQAAELGAEPVLVRDGDPIPAALRPGALATVAAGYAAVPEEACRGADGTAAGSPGAARACLNSDRHRARVEAAVKRVLEAGFAGVCIDLPDAPLALGVF